MSRANRGENGYRNEAARCQEGCHPRDDVELGGGSGLGLHADPWSFPYGLREAVGYTASDLIQLGAILLDTPVSLALVGATYLVVVPRLPPGMRVIAAWALLPIFANAVLLGGTF